MSAPQGGQLWASGRRQHDPVSVEEHLERVLRGVAPLAPLDLVLAEAHGRLLAEDVVSATALPPFDNSSMDGYAVRVEDVAGASESTPVTLPVVGDVPAGTASPYTVQPGFTARVMTGAPLPPGAEAVVPVEWTDGGVAAVVVRRAPEPGQYVRRRGEDVAEGETVLRAGTRIGPPQVGLLAAVGRPRVPVRPRPRVVVMSTGSELVEPGQPLAPGQISDSNSFMLTAAVREAGCIAYNVGIVPDERRVLLDAIEDQLIRADLVITTGGVSAGAYDMVKDVLSRLGTVRFDRVRMQPGMPQGFGVVGPDSTPIITLPGNPVSAFVSFEVFVRPALRRMLGVEPLQRPLVRAVLTEGLRSPAGKRQYARARLDASGPRPRVAPVGGPGSHLVGDLALSDALVVVPEDVTEVPAGAEVDVMVLERRRA
ncbi:gephyrin-like molybdotransferase Glp [Vallicoccus soli]|uniref:Molybdopterin molybdenumtransferase n=1 Tax=Vallicoccus soli TaxID=2339232 RepID=A0A3A3Z9T2_9ACTN|nr:gephyrin-like molybdotransferase Glp [Vallicoccus soli]RJK97846.1 molybdopterin molybdenumtransferase MoeA [Vallicoccus soli]